MTPERANEYVAEYGNNLNWDMQKMILIACREERRAALTEAMEQCKRVVTNVDAFDRIQELRDKEPT